MRYLLFLFTFPLLASILNYGGFESGSYVSDSSTASVGSPTCLTTPSGGAHSGDYSLRINCAAANGASLTLQQFGSVTGRPTGNFGLSTMYAGFWFKVDTAPTTNNTPIARMHNGTANVRALLKITPSRTLVLDNNSVEVATGTTPLTLGAWYAIEWSNGTGTGAAYQVLINKVSEFSGTADFGTGTLDSFVLIKPSAANETTDFGYDDWYVDNAGFQTGFLTAQVKVLTPNAAGNYTGWTNDYTYVDEIPPDDITTMIASTGTGTAVASYGLISSATAGISGTIIAARGMARCRESSSGTSAIKILIRSSTTDLTVSSGFNATTAFDTSVVGLLALVDPATSAAWTTSGLDGLEVGVNENGATVVMQCTQLLADALFYTSTSNNKRDSGVILLQ